MLKEKNTKPRPAMLEESASYCRREKKNDFSTDNDERGNGFGREMLQFMVAV